MGNRELWPLGRAGSRTALALETEPGLVWGGGDGGDHFFPFEGGMLQGEGV